MPSSSPRPCSEPTSQAGKSEAPLHRDPVNHPFHKYECITPVTHLVLGVVFVVGGLALFALPGFLWMFLTTHTFAEAAEGAVSDVWCLTFDALFWTTTSITLCLLMDGFNPPIETQRKGGESI